MEVKDWEKMVSEHEDVNLSLAFPALMRKVYLWMTLALGISGLTAYLVATSPGILQLIYGNSLTIWVSLIAELVLVFKISGSVWKERRSLAATTLMFALRIERCHLVEHLRGLCTSSHHQDLHGNNRHLCSHGPIRLFYPSRPHQTGRIVYHGHHWLDYRQCRQHVPTFFHP